VTLGRVLGEGMFGRTCLGTWRGGDLAVKCVRVAKESEASSFLREVAALAAIRHPNVMQFFGKWSSTYCKDSRGTDTVETLHLLDVIRRDMPQLRCALCTSDSPK
jgi:serine/threonine protein kinase